VVHDVRVPLRLQAEPGPPVVHLAALIEMQVVIIMGHESTQKIDKMN
jgi:hypothetical protein